MPWNSCLAYALNSSAANATYQVINSKQLTYGRIICLVWASVSLCIMWFYSCEKDPRAYSRLCVPECRGMYRARENRWQIWVGFVIWIWLKFSNFSDWTPCIEIVKISRNQNSTPTKNGIWLPPALAVHTVQINYTELGMCISWFISCLFVCTCSQ